MAPAITGLIEGLGWRLTYVVLGISILVISLIAVQFLRSNPGEMGLQAYGESKNASQVKKNRELSLKQAYHTRQFWMVCLIYFCFGLLHLSVMVHIVPHAIGMGISAIQASIILSIMGGVSFAGRLIMGSVSDRIKVKNGAIISLALLTVGLLWLQQTDSLLEYYAFAVIFGLGYGGLSCMQSLLAVELFGLSAVGVITAIFSFGFNLGGSIGPVLSGYIYDISGSYRWAFIICLIFSLVALLVSLYPKKPVKVAENG
jgi:MFS family permease